VFCEIVTVFKNDVKRSYMTRGKTDFFCVNAGGLSTVNCKQTVWKRIWNYIHK
jgi:hypothetical protein